MAPKMATSRLQKEVIRLKKEPPPGITAEPSERDILTWHYAVRGPPGTPYERGAYVGLIRFPPEYPMKPPALYMKTPSGRFVVNEKICTSMSDYHPETWNPLWSVGSIIQGIRSFMASEEGTTGAVRASDAERRRLAEASWDFFRQSRELSGLFGGDLEGALRESDVAAEAAEAKAREAASSANATTTAAGRRRTTRGGRRMKTPGRSGAEKDGEKETKSDAAAAAADGVDNLTLDDGAPATAAADEISEEEAARRAKRNAKKRARKKRAKAAAAAAAAETTTTDGVSGNDVEEEVEEGDDRPSEG